MAANVSEILGISKKNLEAEAVDQMTLRATALEYGNLIKSFKGMRVLTQCVSVASGFCFFYYKLSSFISGFVGAEVVSAIAAIGFLIAIEAVVQYTVTKSTKMALLKNQRAALGMAGIGAIFFVISFYISTEGIYLAISDTTAEKINTDVAYREDVDHVTKEFDIRIDELKKDIEAITPPSWNKGQLTTVQQQDRARKREMINSLYREKADSLASMKMAHKAELQAQQQVAASSASDYYAYVSVILMFELMTNFLVMFFYHKIKRDEDPNLAIRDEYHSLLEQQQHNIKESFWADSLAYQNRLAAQLHFMHSQRTALVPVEIPTMKIAATADNNIQANTTTSPEATTPEKMAAIEKPQRRAGFVIEPLPDEERKEEPEEDPEKSLNAPKWHTQDGDFLKEISGKEVVEVPYPMTEIPEKTESDSEEPVSEKPMAAEAAQETDIPPTFKGGPKKKVIYSVGENGKNVPNGYCYCCHKPLVNKRKDAIWCSPVCKAKGNNFTAVKPGYLK